MRVYADDDRVTVWSPATRVAATGYDVSALGANVQAWLVGLGA